MTAELRAQLPEGAGGIDHGTQLVPIFGGLRSASRPPAAQTDCQRPAPRSPLFGPVLGASAVLHDVTVQHRRGLYARPLYDPCVSHRRWPKRLLQRRWLRLPIVRPSQEDREPCSASDRRPDGQDMSPPKSMAMRRIPCPFLIDSAPRRIRSCAPRRTCVGSRGIASSRSVGLVSTRRPGSRSGSSRRTCTTSKPSPPT